MGDVKDAMDSISFNDSQSDFLHPIPYTMMYVQWEANIIISQQLIRNLGLAFGTIAVVNLVLIADIVVSGLVFLCVGLTLLDIVGGAYFMGLTIEVRVPSFLHRYCIHLHSTQYYGACTKQHPRTSLTQY